MFFGERQSCHFILTLSPKKWASSLLTWIHFQVRFGERESLASWIPRDLSLFGFEDCKCCYFTEPITLAVFPVPLRLHWGHLFAVDADIWKKIQILILSNVIEPHLLHSSCCQTKHFLSIIVRTRVSVAAICCHKMSLTINSFVGTYRLLQMYALLCLESFFMFTEGASPQQNKIVFVRFLTLLTLCLYSNGT